MARQESRVWLVTGASRGLGQAFARAALDAGHRVVGTVRDEAATRAFEAYKPGAAFARRVDMTDTTALAPMVQEVERSVGPIHVLINNAGYGHEGILEESSIDDLRRQFEINGFAPVALIQAVLPSMRRRKAGRILNVTSMGGIMALPGLSYYHGSKFALEGLSESLGKEVRPLGIRVTAIEPGGFRTDWSGGSMVRAQRSIADYDAVFDPLRERRKAGFGKQLGDPAKAAQAVLKLVESDDPPAHLRLGTDAIRLVDEKLAWLQDEFAQWDAVTRSTDGG